MYRTHHPFHEPDKAPEGDGIVLHDCVNRRKQVAHALHVAEILVILVVGKQHVFHLLQVDVGADVRKRRVWVGMGNVLSLEDGNGTICSVHILLYSTNPIEWGQVSQGVCEL